MGFNLCILVIFVTIFIDIWKSFNKKYNVYPSSFEFSYNNSRPPIPNNIRRRVFEKYGWRCVHCSLPYDLQIDHIVPYSWTQNNDINNLQILCAACNFRKSNRFIG